jgi:phosphatidylglycerol:prolipoprotein diacylglycerol transferase
MHPRLFEIPLASLGVLEVPAFGALLALAFGVGLALTLRSAERARLPREAVLGACLAALFAGLFGARLGFVVLHAREVGSVGAALSLRNGGLSGSVGLVVGAWSLALTARRRGLPLARVLDCTALALALGVALTRFGCWLEGCDYGKRLSAAAPGWLARLGTFPAGSYAFVDQVIARDLPAQAARALPVHPSELYESALGLVLCGVLFVARDRERAAGARALFAFVAYFVVRVGVDGTRVSSPDVWCARGVLAVALGFTALAWTRWRRA